MSSNMRVFYLYIVSLITLIMFVAGIALTVYNVSKYIFPNSYAAFDDERDYSYTTDVAINYTYKQNYKRETIKDAVVSALVIVIGYSLYKYHWKLIEKERELLYEDVKGE